MAPVLYAAIHFPLTLLATANRHLRSMLVKGVVLTRVAWRGRALAVEYPHTISVWYIYLHLP